jgi:pyruvate, orthophosphate dikinase
MQVRAILLAAADAQRDGTAVSPEIMIPLVSTVEELEREVALVREVAEEIKVSTGAPAVEHKVGTMIETPRAALLAGKLAPLADFFSFGTNDLTQMSYGLSRDDIGRFLPAYLAQKILPADPFQVRAPRAVGYL